MAIIDVKLKSYDELQFEVITLTTNSYLKDLKIKELEEEIIDLRADYGTKTQIERDLAVDKIEELQERIKELEEEIKIKNRTICHQSIIIMNANEYLETYSNGEFDFDKLANILKGEE